MNKKQWCQPEVNEIGIKRTESIDPFNFGRYGGGNDQGQDNNDQGRGGGGWNHPGGPCS